MTEHQSLFDCFGGVRRLATALGEPPSTVQSWKTTGRIPAGRQPAILELAKKLGVELDLIDVIFPNGRASDVSTPSPDSPHADRPIPREARR